jgi:hypothetical protein
LLALDGNKRRKETSGVGEVGKVGRWARVRIGMGVCYAVVIASSWTYYAI